jgi:hypothetical protein
VRTREEKAHLSLNAQIPKEIMVDVSGAFMSLDVFRGLGRSIPPISARLAITVLVWILVLAKSYRRGPWPLFLVVPAFTALISFLLPFTFGPVVYDGFTISAGISGSARIPPMIDLTLLNYSCVSLLLLILVLDFVNRLYRK